MTTKRQSLSKKTRFDVFKRDGFKCQYCGAHPPSVILHIDHIQPLAFDGSNDIDNLVTSCEPCNLGKGARSLLAIPQSLSEKASEVEEREEQLRGYSAILEAKRERLEDETWRVMDLLFHGEDSVKRADFASAKNFIEKLGVQAVVDAAEIALSSGIHWRKTFKYFCGVCWNRVRELEK